MGRVRGTSLKSEHQTGSGGVQNRRRNRRNQIMRVSWRDEQIEGMSLAVTLNTAEFSDPAILAVKSTQPKYRYTREELLQLRHVPLSQRRPEFLNPTYNKLCIISSSGVWDPELWHRSRSESPNENGVRNEQVETHKRRSGDPRDRLRKEQDGIVLSPQRRSFNSGCFVPLKENQRSNRPHSPLGKTDNSHLGHREIPAGARRIGSGRILTRDVPWDFHDKQDGDGDFTYRRERDESKFRFERRSFGRDFEISKDKDKHGNRNNGRFNNDRRRISNESRDEEPEWFSGGPLSQTETIELRGFDDVECEKMGKKKTQKKKAKERTLSKNVEEDKNANKKPTTVSQEETAPSTNATTKCSPIPETTGDTQEKPEGGSDNSFNFDDIFKCDTIASLLPNGVGGDDGDAVGSRFSRWFKRESPIKQVMVDSRRSSLQDDHLIRNLLNDISEPNVSIPGDSDLYFAPISPAANTGSGNLRQATGMPSIQKPMNLMEMLQRGKQQSEMQVTKNMDVSGKVLSLEELEAKMLHQGGSDPGAIRNPLSQNKQIPQKSEEDLSAFKRLVAQVYGGHATAANNGPIPQKTQHMSILEMLSHSQQQDEAARLTAAAQMMGPTSPNPMPTGHLTNDLAFKLQQVQNQVQIQRQQAQLEMISKFINAGIHHQQLGTSPLPEMGINQSRELLNRPEAQAILQAMHQRIPSPRELQVHTQNIMQRALIKKKLEEQQENYKKRQELQQRCQSPGRGVSPAKHTPSPTPLAFTPTSVLRKMTAEKDDGAKEGNKTVDIHGKLPQGRALTGMKPTIQQHLQPWNMQQQLKQPIGRPIVKANTNLQAQQDQQFFAQQRLYGQQQARKLGPQFSSINHPSAGAPSHQSGLHFSHQHPFSSNPQQFQQQQLTQHQLRAQHQQHQPPQQPSQYGNRITSQPTHWSQHHLLTGSNFDGRSSHMGDHGGASNNGGDLSPTSNQLARWFSPELLERARAGKVPIMPSATTAHHAISLEEIERQTCP